MAAERDEKAGVESIWRCVFGRVCGWEAEFDGLLIKRMKVITKKSYPDLFEKVLAGEKTFDMRVADFDIQPSDILEQIEVNYDGTPTGRKVRHVVGEVLRTKEIDFWKQEDIDQYGYQVMSLAERVD